MRDTSVADGARAGAGSQRTGRMRHLRGGRENQGTADEPAAAPPPRSGGCIAHTALCFPDVA